MVLYQLVSSSGCVNYQHFRKACLYGKPYTPRERVKVMKEMARLDAVHIHWPSGQVPKILQPVPPPATPSPIKPPFDEVWHSCHAPINSATSAWLRRLHASPGACLRVMEGSMMSKWIRFRCHLSYPIVLESNDYQLDRSEERFRPPPLRGHASSWHRLGA
eukprot:7383206-Prymnesium_polylepis.1